jgi:PAS domain S-box-containing protein
MSEGPPRKEIAATEPIDATAAALRASEARMASVLAVTMDAIITLDEARNVVAFNPAAEGLFGHSAERVLGRSVDSLLPAYLRERQAADFDRRSVAGASGREAGIARVVCVRADGRAFRAECRASFGEVDGHRFTTIALRALSPRIYAEEVRDQDRASDAGRTWLLVVDAAVEVARATARPLEREGYSVEIALDASSALAVLDARQHELALVLLDPTLLSRGGLELVRAAAQLDRELPVVIATASATPEFAARAIAAGAREVLAKPLYGRRLLDSIARHARVAPPLH